MSIHYTNDNTIIFTVARMNPPTPGHMYVIQQLIEEAISKNINQVYVILSKSNDDQDNPIPCPEKINVLGNINIEDATKTMINSLKEKMIHEISSNPELQSKINNIHVETICVPDEPRATPFTSLIPLVFFKKNQGINDINLILIIGDDRKNMLDSITDYFLKWENVHSITGIILPREEMTEFKMKSSDPKMLDELNIQQVPINAMSASFVRNIVKNHRRDKFTELYTQWLDKGKIPGLYEMILEGITHLPVNKKSDPPSKPLKYRYPMIKGISEFPIKKKGGKTKKSKYSKKAKYSKKNTCKKTKKSCKKTKKTRYNKHI